MAPQGERPGDGEADGAGPDDEYVQADPRCETAAGPVAAGSGWRPGQGARYRARARRRSAQAAMDICGA
ncbi:MAG: hypothetical protein ABWY78_20160, partial [Microvirga sp.]